MNPIHLLCLTTLAVLSLPGHAQPVKVGVVAVESFDDFGRWLGKPVDPVRAAAPAAYPGNLTRLPIGRKTQFPIVVTGLPSPMPQETQLVADVEILGTDGKSLGVSPRCCEATVARGYRAGAALLTSAVILEPEPGHRKGSYTVRVSVTDGLQTWTTSTVLPYGEADLPGVAQEVPRLRMNVPPGQLESGGPGDRRDCLSLPTPSEVIKCAERGK